MTPRCFEIGEFMLCPLYGAWPLPEPLGVKLSELSCYLLENIKDPSRFGVDVLGWA